MCGAEKARAAGRAAGPERGPCATFAVAGGGDIAFYVGDR